MGDLTWLIGLQTATTGLVVWLMRWIVKREREISGQWRQVAETALANNEKILAAIEASPSTGRHHYWDGSGRGGYGATSIGPPGSPGRR